MNPLLLKFLKHAGFVLAGAVVAALLAFFSGDPTFLAYIEAHPALSGVVPLVSGLLGALAKYIADMDAAQLWMIPGPVEVVVWVGGIVFTGGVGWWAHYVTGGASKAHLLSAEVEHLRKAFVKYELAEESEFRILKEELAEVRESVTVIKSGLGEVHGMLQALVAQSAR